jgi:hypothetical protein
VRLTKSLASPALIAVTLALATGPALAQDVALCFGTADRVVSRETVDEATKQAGHEACQRALAETSSVVQKYHLQEADFDIVGRPPKASN